MSTSAQTPQSILNNPTFIVGAGCLVAMIAFGIRSTMGLFNTPMIEAYGWNREIFGIAMALQNLLWGLMQPFAGMLADKFGSMRVIFCGALVYSAGTLMMGLSTTPGMLYLGGGVLMGIGIATTSFSIIMASFGRIVPPEKRSWAFGLATAASSLGQFIFAPLGQGFIAAYGWQTALFIMAGMALLMILFALPLRVAKGGVAQGENELPLTLPQAMKRAFGHSSYLLLISGFFVCGFQVAFITVHLPPFLVERGVSTTIAAWSIGLIGLFNIIGSYISGVYGNKYSKRYGLSFIYAARAAVIVWFILTPISSLSAVVFTCLMGLLWLSTVPLTMGLVMAMFGTRYMATLYGFVFLSHQIGSFLGVWLGGRFYDLYGNYNMIWYLSIGLGIFAAIVHWPIREQQAASFTTQTSP